MKNRKRKSKRSKRKMWFQESREEKIRQKHLKEISNKSWCSNTQNIKETDPQDDTEVKIVLDQ